MFHEQAVTLARRKLIRLRTRLEATSLDQHERRRDQFIPTTAE